MNFEDITAIKEQVASKFFSYSGVHAIGISRNKESEFENEFSILTYVSQSETIEKIRMGEKHLLGSAIINFIVEPPLQRDILYLTSVNIPNEDQGRYRPMLGGIQINVQNNEKSWLGTIGTFVQSQDASDKKIYLLSNLHVLKTKGLKVYQPLYAQKNKVGSVSTAKEFADTDAALALVDEPSDIALNFIETIGKVSKTKALTSADLNSGVVKRGRTTALTEGTIESIGVRVILDDGDIVDDCVIVRAYKGKLFSDKGDSGSPVVLQNGQELVGLHFAGNQTPGGTSCFCQIKNVFKNLNIKLPD